MSMMAHIMVGNITSVVAGVGITKQSKAKQLQEACVQTVDQYKLCSIVLQLQKSKSISVSPNHFRLFAFLLFYDMLTKLAVHLVVTIVLYSSRAALQYTSASYYTGLTHSRRNEHYTVDAVAIYTTACQQLLVLQQLLLALTRSSRTCLFWALLHA
jgi:hypothetical protein